MRYFKLFNDMSSSDRWYLDEVTLPDGTEPMLASGIRFHGEGVLRTSVHHPGPPVDFCMTSFDVPIVTAKLAQAIEGIARADVQCLPVQIAGYADRVALVATRLVHCLDERQSIFVKWTSSDHRADLAGDYRVVRKLVVDPALIPLDAHFFRMKGWEVALIVSEAVKEAMERAGCTGADFRDVNPPPGG